MSEPAASAGLPRSWTRMSMGEIGRWVGGGTPSKANQAFWTDGTIPWVSPKDMKTDRISDAQDHITDEAVSRSATNLIDADSVLVVVRSGILQHTLPVAVTTRRVALNQDLKAVTPHKGIRPDYLALALKAFEREILHTCTKTGTTVQSLELPAFLKFEIPIAPPEEQHAIVRSVEEQFTRLDAGVASLRRVQANLKRYRAAVLKAACEGRLVPTEAELARKEGRTFESGEDLLARILLDRRRWFDKRRADNQTRKQYAGPQHAEGANAPSIPEGWAWGTWDQLTNWVTYGFTRPMPHVDQGIPIITAKGVNKGRIEFEGAHLTTEDAYRRLSEKDRPLPGDILITKDGTIGRAAVVDADREFCINQSVAVLWLRSCPMERRFLLTVIESEHTQKPIWAKARGVAIQHLSITDFAKLPVPIPPLVEQTRIVAEVERRLSVVEELEAVVTANLQRAVRLRQSVLQAAFFPPRKDLPVQEDPIRPLGPR